MSSTPSATNHPGLVQTLERRTMISLAAMVIALVPVVVFGLINGQWSASSWAIWGC